MYNYQNCPQVELVSCLLHLMGKTFELHLFSAGVILIGFPLFRVHLAKS